MCTNTRIFQKPKEMFCLEKCQIVVSIVNKYFVHVLDSYYNIDGIVQKNVLKCLAQLMLRPFTVCTLVKEIHVTSLTIRKDRGVDLGIGFRKITIEIVGTDNDIKQACNIKREKGMSLESTYIRREEEEEDPVRKIKMQLER